MPFGLGLSVCNNPLAHLYRDTQGNAGHKVLLLLVFLEQQPGLQQPTIAKMVSSVYNEPNTETRNHENQRGDYIQYDPDCEL